MNDNREFRCRLQKVTVDNLKNVGHGEIRFACNMREDIFEDKADILGIYGQNGSGKTTFVFAITILQQLLGGVPFPEKVCFIFIHYFCIFYHFIVTIIRVFINTLFLLFPILILNLNYSESMIFI